MRRNKNDYSFAIKVIDNQACVVESFHSAIIDGRRTISLVSALDKNSNIVQPVYRSKYGVFPMSNNYKTEEDIDKFFRGNKQVMFRLTDVKVLFSTTITFDEDGGIADSVTNCFVPSEIRGEQMLAKKLVSDTEEKVGTDSVKVAKAFIEGYCKIVIDNLMKYPILGNRVEFYTGRCKSC